MKSKCFSCKNKSEYDPHTGDLMCSIPDCHKFSRYEPKGTTKKPQTNADRIRGMSDEELAEHLYRWDNSPLHASLERWLEWLKQEAKEGE